jgi:hypothetical protein
MPPTRPPTPSHDSQPEDGPSAAEILGLKRRLVALQQQIDEAAAGGAKKPP